MLVGLIVERYVDEGIGSEVVARILIGEGFDKEVIIRHLRKFL